MRAESLCIRGRRLGPHELAVIREVIAGGGSRRAISVAVCERLGWRQRSGRLWDRACRSLLLALAAAGLIALPPPRKRMRQRHPVPLTPQGEPRPPLEEPVGALAPVRLVRVDRTPLVDLWKEFIQRYHYLGLAIPVGPHVRYLVGWEGGWLGALGFAGAAWSLVSRDRWIGWSPAQRRASLHRVINQTRFLLLPWVRSHNCASHVLALASRRIVPDWTESYGYRPLLLETFVDARRFAGTCYRAANWLYLGRTQGRGKMDRFKERSLSLKDIYVYPLTRRVPERLCNPTGSCLRRDGAPARAPPASGRLPRPRS